MKIKINFKAILTMIVVGIIALTAILSGCADGTPSACEHEWSGATCTTSKTCKKCNNTEGEALGHDYADATCTAPKTCKTCGATEGEALGHDFADATCTAPKTCKRCSATEGEALGHDFADATCTVAKTCKTCGATEGEALGHDFADATCTVAKTCKTCGATEGEALGHDFADATCTAPETCKTCGATEGEALGHDFADATCTAAKTCKTCGATEGEALGHNFENADCTVAKTCKTCGATEGAALGHDFADATCTAPKTCKTCGATEGEVLGHDYADATCTAPKTCKRCSATEGEVIGHDFADATCAVAKTCKICGATEGEALGHDFADATCTEAKTCKICGTTEGDALGHSWIEATYTNPETCVRCGITVGTVLSRIIPDDRNLVLGLANIPIAKPGMSEAQLRDIVVRFMWLQINFAYTPTFSSGSSYSYYIKNLYSLYNGSQSLENLRIKFEEGKYYGGVPYMGNAAGSLYRWLPFYNVDTGEMNWDPILNSKRDWTDNGRYYSDVGSALFGNSCSSACFWAYGRVSNKIASCWTAGWLPKNGFVKVGEYTLANNDTGHGDNTKNVCKSNGTAVMYAAYALVKKADGFVHTGHAAMAVGNAVVVYNADGSINGEKSYVPIAEQKASFLTASPVKGGKDLYSPLNDNGLTYRIMGNYAGNIVNGSVKEMKWTFKYLYDGGYLPFTAPELVGKDPVETATVTFSHKKTTITVSELSSANVTSNYAISDVHFYVKNSSGNEEYIGMYAKEAGTISAYRTSYMSEALKNNIIYDSSTYIKTQLEKYAGSGYTLVIKCRVSTGELLTAYTGKLN